MESRKKLFALVLFAGVLMATAAFADDNPGMCNRGMGKEDGMKMGDMMKMEDKVDMEEKFYHKICFLMMNGEKLQLTAEQKEKIHDLKFKIKKDMIMKDAQEDVLKLDIMEMLMKEDPQLNEVNKLIDKKYEIGKQKAKDLAESYIDLCNVLTKEQKTMAKDLWMQTMMMKMKKMMGDDDGPKCPMCMKKMCPMMGGMKGGTMGDMKGGGMNMEKKAE